jgi:uncharacterized membrane protein
MQPASQGGIDKKTGSWLSYLLWWITGIIMLFVGKNDPDVKFHAAQSVVFFGSITAINIVLGIINSFIGYVWIISDLVWLFGVVIWVIALIKAFQGNGERFQLPLVGGVVTPYAEQLANAVT